MQKELQTMPANPIGFHTNLTPHVKDHIVSHVPGNYVIGQVARMAMIPKRTLARWLKRGEEEAETEKQSIFTQLWLEFELKRGSEIMEMLADVKMRRTNWQASWELLRTIAREDFGVEAVEYKELLDLYTKLSEAFKRFTDSPLQGVVSNGREMDSKGNIEEQG
jgi:hypothetical protein